MKDELYVSVLLMESQTAVQTALHWLQTVAHNAPRGPADMANPVWLADIARRAGTTPAGLLHGLRERLDDGHVPTSSEPELADVLRLRDQDVLDVISEALEYPADSMLLDVVFDVAELARSFLVGGSPPSVLDVLDGLALLLESPDRIVDVVTLSGDWEARLRRAMNSGIADALGSGLGCAPEDVVRQLVTPPAVAPAGRLDPDDTLAQRVDFLSLDSVRARLRQLIATALGGAAAYADLAGAVFHEGRTVPELPASLAWFGDGDYRRALLAVSAGDRGFTLRERGFRLADPSETETAEQLVELRTNLGLAPGRVFEAAGFWVARLDCGCVLVADPDTLDPTSADALGGSLAGLAAELGPPPGVDADPRLTPAEFLDRTLWEPSSLTALWRGLIATEGKAAALFCLAGLSPGTATLAPPTRPDPISFPSPPEGLPAAETIDDSRDVEDWLKSPTGVLGS